MLENFDKMVSGGTHYASKQMFPEFPGVVGHNGIGVTDDEQLVGFAMIRAPYGSFAERTVARHILPVPQNVDVAVASALPASVLTHICR